MYQPRQLFSLHSPLSSEVVGCDTVCSTGPDRMERTWRRHRPDVI